MSIYISEAHTDSRDTPIRSLLKSENKHDRVRSHSLCHSLDKKSGTHYRKRMQAYIYTSISIHTYMLWNRL
jgi:hypothetical protein